MMLLNEILNEHFNRDIPPDELFYLIFNRYIVILLNDEPIAVYDSIDNNLEVK